MAAVDLDRQAIERRDFPISRRGYEAAAVDAHLRALAGELEDLQRTALSASGQSSMASAAGSQVQSIIEAAESASAEIERQALENARKVREEAERDAGRTRDEAVEKARAHVAAVSRVAAELLQRVGSMDGEVAALMESLRAGSGRLSSDLAAIEKSMGELYDAASGRATSTGAPEAAAEPTAAPGEAAAPIPAPEQAAPPTPAPAQAAPPTPAPPIPASAPTPAAPRAAPQPASPAAETGGVTPAPAASGDLDGARLIALNMALNGDSREDTDRYLAANFQLADRAKLVDEVYAAIEG
jgi:hypothetical protein